MACSALPSNVHMCMKVRRAGATSADTEITGLWISLCSIKTTVPGLRYCTSELKERGAESLRMKERNCVAEANDGRYQAS